MFVTVMTHFIISHVYDFCLHQSFTGNWLYYQNQSVYRVVYGHWSLEVFFLVVIVVVNYFSEMFRYITGNSKCAIQTFVYKPLYVLTLRQDKGRGIRRINPSTAIILLCLPIKNFGLSFHKTPEIEYSNVIKII